ncbi:hypothetical protein [Colwellia psychrerythraea]|uniref:Lipoprotein n=1 Tax=Colwellia psychrerythraea TaxID=28229 RepID=A0A099KNJ9_COLPS|nr:hypothetical protein [Colwellia psychrerythraea]KGJ91198.1 hypothetical protein GAB14E_3350 [Colwellia psychrerythraea]
MKVMDKKKQLASALQTSLLLCSLSACSNMQTTNSGALFAESQVFKADSKQIAVSWHINEANLITVKEQHILNTILLSSLETELAKFSDIHKVSDIHIRAAVTRVETVSEPLNWLSTIALFLPLDRGGVAVEFVAFDAKTKQSIVQLNFAQWTPLTEFTARFDRLAPAEISMNSAALAFITELQKELSKE